MKRYIFLLMLPLLLPSCGGKTQQGNTVDTTYLEKPDSAAIVELAEVMKRDIRQMLLHDDIQSTAALCQEALDNIAYFQSSGDNYSTRIYANALRKFIHDQSETIDDMSTQNYIIKQFVVTVNKFSSPAGGSDKASDAPAAPDAVQKR